MSYWPFSSAGVIAVSGFLKRYKNNSFKIPTKGSYNGGLIEVNYDNLPKISIGSKIKKNVSRNKVGRGMIYPNQGTLKEH